MTEDLKVTVIGAGNGGKAMAAHMALLGKEVTLCNRTFEHISVIAERGGIDLDYPGGLSGFGRLVKVTDKIEEGLRENKLIMVVVPSSGHRDVAIAAAPYLRDDHIVVLHPGRTGGALEFSATIKQEGCKTNPLISEAETFIFASRSEGPSEARLFRIKESVPIAALPGNRTREVLDAIHTIYPQYIHGGNVLKTGLNNMGAIFHPALAMLNTGWIEARHGEFEFYVDGVTPSVAKVLEVLDRERVTVASALGLRARTGLEWLELAYNAKGENLYEAMHNQSGYYGIKAPPTMNHRYITEEIPMSLVPIASLGERYGVSVRGIDSIIRLACIMHNTDYWRKGRTVEKLGISDMSIEELTRFVETGERD
ncbi:MAG TPA: NAD/NADP octopine/nopaline dehydrogenase family protein [Anaerolineaceae bacterium]|nr:NAD/NADP octopine/nopaline dehydrogenase family protein [Anaerolineaceae bacterium]